MTDDRSALPPPAAKPPVRIVLARGAMLFGLWIVLMQSAKTGDLAVGALATVAATWASLRLLPPESRTRAVRRFARVLLPRFLWQSLKAGIDVARRAFAPSLPLPHRLCRLPHGFPARAGAQQFRHDHEHDAGHRTGGRRPGHDRVPLPRYTAADRGADGRGRAPAREGARAGGDSWLTSCSPPPVSCWRWSLLV